MKHTCNNKKLKQRRCELRVNQTDAEKCLWMKLRNRQLNGLKFYRQYSFDMYILDFYSPEIRLVIELDGGQHAEHEKIEYDEARTEYLKAHEIHVIRFWNNEVMKNLDGVLDRIID